MAEEAIKKILKDFGLTRKESDVYIFLSKYGILKCNDVAKGMKRYKAQIYRILKILENKGLVETTLETPARFIPIPFEKALDLGIKAKHDEAALMEKTRKEVAVYWKNIRHTSFEPLLQKFVVLEGDHRIYSKISQLVRDAQTEVSMIMTFPDLVRIDTFGVLDAISSYPIRSNTKCRFLTDISNQDTAAVKSFLKKTQKIGLEFRVENPNSSLTLSPRMIIKDNDEMVFFITKKDTLAAYPDEECLWTNCKELVNSFCSVFNDLWQNSLDLKTKIAEIEMGKLSSQTCTIHDGEAAKEKYEEILQNAKDEIVFVTSAEGLIRLSRDNQLLNKWARDGVFVRIMAPVVKENLEAVHRLSESCFVKHTSATYTNSTIVDGKSLFQFKRRSSSHTGMKMVSDFADTFYSSDEEYIERAKNTVNYIWKNACEVSKAKVVSLQEFLFPTPPRFPRKNMEYSKLMGWIAYAKPEIISEEEVANKFMNPRRLAVKNLLKDTVRYYGCRAGGVIRRSQVFDLPDLVIMPFSWNEHSSFGAENRLLIYAKVNNAEFSFMPVATVGDNDAGMAYMEKTQAGTPSAKTQTVGKGELEVRLDGNTLFVGWTVPINLNLSGLALPPGLMIFEAYGDNKTAMFKSKSPSGRMQVSTNIFSEASMTFFNSLSKSSGKGSDAFLVKCDILTAYPSRHEKKQA
jgi:sugar-specific transcriptional regulator TrmB